MEILYRFLLVSLEIEAILGEVTIGQRRKKLEEMARGNGLSDAYTATLTRLKGQKGNKSVLGWKVLMWVLYSERPLRAEELCQALGVEIGSADLDPTNVPPLRTLLASCLGLVTIEASSSIVRLVHFTLQEHLLTNLTLFHSPQATIAEVCLTYLNFGSVRDISPTLPSAPSTMPFLEYASCYWGKHTRMEITENVKTLALRLLDRFDEHISAQLLLLHHWRDGSLGQQYRKLTGFTGLHGASFLGGVEIVSGVLGMKEWDINGTDCMGKTALTWAARKGHQEVVKMLLEREDINPDQPETENGRTPLSCAAERGHEGVVEMLLERGDVNPDRADSRGRTPLLWAAEKGYEGVVKILLEREEVNPDQSDAMYARTPLVWATRNGHEGVVKMLLERGDVNPDRAESRGRTPLLWATRKGHEGIVKMLLERDGVNPDLADTKYGRTPLALAALRGREGIVKILLEREGVNPNQADTENGRTPLALAAKNGHAGVVRILLQRRDVHTSTTDNKTKTPLSLAVSQGHDKVVRILWENANSLTTDCGGQASLPSTGHVSGCAVDMQFSCHNPDTNIVDLTGQLASPQADPDDQGGVSDLHNSVPKPADTDLSTTEPSVLPQPPSMSPLKVLCPSEKTHTHPSTTQSTLSLRLNRYFLIASFVCLLAFLVYVAPPPLPYIPSSRR